MKNNDFILIGEIVGAIGIKGEVKVKSYSESPDRFGALDHIFILEDKNLKDSDFAEFNKTEIESSRTQKNQAIVKFKGVETRNQAEEMVGLELYINESQLDKLPKDTYYVKDLIGLRVYEDETEIGEVKDVLQTGPSDIYVISPGNRMIPGVKEFIKEINIEEGYIRVNLIEGL